VNVGHIGKAKETCRSIFYQLKFFKHQKINDEKVAQWLKNYATGKVITTGIVIQIFQF